MSLRHAELKAGRALEHLEGLKRELQAYYNSNPCPVTLFKKPEIGRRFLRVDFTDLSDNAYLLVGDFAHNLRSVLDHIVYSLVVEATGAIPKSNTIQWPVLISPNKKKFRKQTKGVPDAAAAIIDSHQPYHATASGSAPKEHPLWQLHILDIVDKHRRVPVNEREFKAGFPTLSLSADFTKESGDRYFEFSFPIDAPPVPMHYNPPVIRFGAGEESLFLTADELDRIYQFVTQSVAS